MIPGNKLEMIILDTKDTAPGTANASFEVVSQNCVGTIDATTALLSELAQNILQNYMV